MKKIIFILIIIIIISLFFSHLFIYQYAYQKAKIKIEKEINYYYEKQILKKDKIIDSLKLKIAEKEMSISKPHPPPPLSDDIKILAKILDSLLKK